MNKPVPTKLNVDTFPWRNDSTRERFMIDVLVIAIKIMLCHNLFGEGWKTYKNSSHLYKDS